METNAAPARKLAYRLERGDIIRHERRVYRVTAVDLMVLYPRNARLTGAPTRTAYRATMVPTRRSGGRSVQVTFEQTTLVTLVAA